MLDLLTKLDKPPKAEELMHPFEPWACGITNIYNDVYLIYCTDFFHKTFNIFGPTRQILMYLD